MKNKDYLFAVASLRSRENELLTKDDFEQLISAESYQKAASLLSEKGYDVSGDYSAVLDRHMNEVWEDINKAAPDAEVLKAFVVKNDFHNLKAILKSEVMDYNAEDYMLSPSIVPKDKMLEAVSQRKFSELPDYIAKAGEKALEVITQTQNAQLCDAICDTAALEAIISFVKESGDEILKEYADLFCLSADIKTAFRAIKTKKSPVFLNAAIAENSLIDKKEFINAALSGIEDFGEYLKTKGFEEFALAYESSPSAFEKYCDDKMISVIKKAKMTVFGVSPVAAYFVAKENEIKCLRIILSAKQSRISEDIIRERMRESYV